MLQKHFRLAWVACSFIFLLCSWASASTLFSQPEYEFEIEQEWLRMPDGVRLSATLFRPRPLRPEEKFPALLELLPYRKDDQFYVRDYPLYSYFARRGYVAVKVDIRGTGSSEGATPDREYSETELQDAVEIIGLLAEAPWCNGKIGMWGISWGGFNAIQVAMRKPPALKAILAMDASDDLYKDDVHFIDGIFHVDEYELSIDHDLGLPQSPDYPLNREYFENRFSNYPWFLTYLKNQLDGEFWRENSLRWQYDRMTVPAYLIGGLLDGYRDSVPRMLESVKAPVKGVIGPWPHAFPDNGKPGPNYEWRHEAVRWWDHWLKDMSTGIMDEPQFALFVRGGHAPGTADEVTPGHWRYEEWPIQRTRWVKMHPDRNGVLRRTPEGGGRHDLTYSPGYGSAAGYWWGDITGDMRAADAGCLVYDSEELQTPLEIVGFPKVSLLGSVDAPLAHWVVRLEDVHPDGRVSLVTGAGLNGSQRESRLEPSAQETGVPHVYAFDLHFTTWTFQRGHRIRVTISNGQFPMFWPTPAAMRSSLDVGTSNTYVTLPVIPLAERPVPEFLPSEPREQRKDARRLPSGGWPAIHSTLVNHVDQTTSVTWRGESNYEISGRRYYTFEEMLHRTSNVNPANSSFSGEAGHRIELGDRQLELKTFLEVHSDKETFKVDFTRRIFENGVLIRERTWSEIVPRRFQ